GVCPGDDLAITDDLERTEREDAAHGGMDADRSWTGKRDVIARLAPVDRERHQRPAGKERAARSYRRRHLVRGARQGEAGTAFQVPVILRQPVVGLIQYLDGISPAGRDE